MTGYNQYLAQTGLSNLAVECANQPWVKPISAKQLLTYLLSIARAASGAESSFIQMAYLASPGDDVSPYLGSNAWALGGERTENGKGALLANPHFPLTGNLRFWQSHITIPGVLNVMGASLQGFPGVINIGFNDSVGWSHTVTSARQFALYQLSMDPNNPLTYWVDIAANTIKTLDLSSR
ncbi:MAG: penicillin acylase family protein [Algicola sp.]|nr:penicillin acylase family protein [Algicola sp.]